MHYGLLVIVDPDGTEGRDEATMHHLVADVMEFHQARWDWWRLGGRWTGTLDGYHPETDTWPGQWPFHQGDVQPVRALTAEYLDHFYAVVVDGDWFGGERYEPWQEQGKFIRVSKPPLAWLIKEYGDQLAVVVDAHY